MKPIWELLKEIERELWDGVPAHVLGALPDMRWNIEAIGKTKQWSAEGLAVLFSVPILLGGDHAVPCIEVTLEMRQSGFHIKAISSSVEGAPQVVTCHTDVADLIEHCRGARREANRKACE